MWAPTSENRRVLASAMTWPRCPPRSATGAPSPGPKPSVPTASPRHEAASRHSAPARKGRTPAGSAGRMTSRAPAATSATGVAHATRPIAHVSPSTMAWPASPPSQPA